MKDERMMLNFSILVGRGTGPETTAPLRSIAFYYLRGRLIHNFVVVTF
jgi:hypothetical protein